MGEREFQAWTGSRDREMVDRLAHRIIHDLNNLMTATLGYSQLAADATIQDLGEEARDEALAAVGLACEQASGLTHALSLVMGESDTTIDAVDGYTVTGCLRDFWPILHRLLPSVEIPEDFGSGMNSPVVPGSPRQLHVALVSFVMYLRRAILKGSSILMETHRSRSRLVLSFRVCEMSTPANTRAYTELEMANTLLHEEGATLDVQQDGSDELLSISLNIESWHEQATSTETSRECAEVSGESVLVVEPRRHIREIIKAELHVAGYRTDCVSQLKLDATADTDLLKETKLLVATFQGSAEDHDVRSWVDEIRRLRPDLPLVLIADFDPETDGLEQVVVLRKPIRLPDLTRVVGLTLGRSGSD